MKEDTGFILLKITNNTTNDVVFSSISKFIKDNPYQQICIFNSSNDRICNELVPIVHLNQAKFFNGNLVVFDTMSLLFAKNFPNIKTIFMYASDIFWSKNSYSSYKNIESLFKLSNLEFIASNQETYDVYQTCWKKPIGICENFNYEKLKKLI
tara:strand:+ start:2036 stop:2494 length:459 start_codon:yes stop_codon:yes gene_type:complete